MVKSANRHPFFVAKLINYSNIENKNVFVSLVYHTDTKTPRVISVENPIAHNTSVQPWLSI